MSTERWQLVRSAVRAKRKQLQVNSHEYRRHSILIGQITRHIEYHGAKQPARYDISRMSGLMVLAQAFENGERVVVFDSEWPYQPHPYRTMNEIGLTVIEDGRVEVHNVQIGDYRKDGEFVRGRTQYMTDVEAKAWLRMQTRDARCIVGHALDSDRAQLAKWGWRFTPGTVFADTGVWSAKMYSSKGDRIALVNLARRMGVPKVKNLHCAGNDAYLTLQVARAIVQNAMKERNATASV